MNQSTTRARSALRVLIAEDNFLIGDLIAQILGDAGCEIVGPFEELGEVLGAVRQGLLDGAVLDLELNGACVLPAAAALAERDIPFILATGRGNSAGLPGLLARAPFLSKPFEAAQLQKLVLSTFGPRCAAC